MLKSHEKFHSANGKRLILIVDDELVNRELMGAVLHQDYEVIFAENGEQAMEMVMANRDTLSLVLLDLMMPVMSGKEVLRRIKANPFIRQIPIIVLTADQDAEVESLNLGAADFIPKPYPDASVILARVLRSIELFEDRQIIMSTERDPLTGLYNREYFYSYAEQFDLHHKDTPMDAIVVDVNSFHMINERFGTAYGDKILRRIGERLRDEVANVDGIVCRREADTFMVYCPHGKNYKKMLANASVGLTDGDVSNNRTRLRMGVYEDVDKSLEIERRFDRAKMAADTVRNSFTKTIGIYDKELHERKLYAEQLIEDFPAAIAQHQFEVWYQPKFDIRPEIPVLASAEALVRWRHPKLGMINPGIFIPLFEDNGLVQELDSYVWRTAAAQIRSWKDRLGFSAPVSVNVSRIDMYDANLVGTLQGIIEESGIDAGELLLEITESAYTQESEQIVAAVDKLRALGFRIEMDDFGTGYSSLNMISTLPIDALKLDMQFVRTAFSGKHDTRMLEVIIDIAAYLGVPVIAEGVETEEQLQTLRAMGCDMVQGYYFSRPVPAGDYEPFVVERKGQNIKAPSPHQRILDDSYDETRGTISYALSSGFVSVYYVDTDSDHYVLFSADGPDSDLQIVRSGSDFFADVQALVNKVVHPDDRQHMCLMMQKGTLVYQLTGNQAFSMTYRLTEGMPSKHRAIKVARASSGHHIVIGIRDIDAQARHEEWGSQKDSLDFDTLARALSKNMEIIYYVDALTDTYLELKGEGLLSSLDLVGTGTNFFDECCANLSSVIHPEDRERVCSALAKDELLMTLESHGSFSADFRLMIDGQALFYRLKAIFAGGSSDGHLIIGISNIDAQITEEQKLEVIQANVAVYARIAQALAKDYFCIYYVNTDTDQFVEYTEHSDFQSLSADRQGDNFFEMYRESIRRTAHPEDLPQFLSLFTKERLERELDAHETFVHTFRLVADGKFSYMHLKATRMADASDPHIVIGISNIDSQVRADQAHAQALHMAREAAYRDQLTGVKSKLAYAEREAELDARLSRGEQVDFAIMISDVNDLKTVNDTLGHAAGDELIRNACHTVCEIFRHSPVFRYGGDEFVAILREHDYDHRDALMEQLAAINEERVRTGGVVVAGGLAVYDHKLDRTVAEVFERADKAMYINKHALKGRNGNDGDVRQEA